ncbi:hypothetical protein F4Y93_12885 [Candidatus Poribacteria bacterium]|nr:hypothetical protein [Candidatus Poribacteria bacterium]
MHVSCESAFKATAKIQGIEVQEHQYIEAAIKMFNQGKLKHQFDAFQAIGTIPKDTINVYKRVRSFRERYLEMVRQEDDLARVPEREIASIILRHDQLKSDFTKAYEESLVRKQMTSRLERAFSDLLTHYPSLMRQIKFQAGATRLTKNIAWPAEMDALVAGALLYPHRHSTRYGNNPKRKLVPRDYRGMNPPGIVPSLGALCKMVRTAASRIELDIRDIEEHRLSDSMID